MNALKLMIIAHPMLDVWTFLKGSNASAMMASPAMEQNAQVHNA